MTLVFRNKLDPDLGRQIFPPAAAVQTISNVTQLKAAMTTPGNYHVLAGTYVADLVLTADNVTLTCDAGTVFQSNQSTSAALRVLGNNFILQGSWEIPAGLNIGLEIGDNTFTSQSQQPDNIYIAGGRIYCVTTCLRGIGCHGSNVTFQNMRVEGMTRPTQEAQAIWVNNTNGPITLLDSFWEGAGENILFGGDRINIDNAVPSDIHVARCTFYKRPSWRPPFATTVKNIFEVKNGQRFLIEDCVFDGSWKDAQGGDSLVFTVRNSGATLGDNNPWVIVDDITLSHCVLRNAFEPSGAAVSILGHDDGGRASQQTQIFHVTNCCFEDSTLMFKINHAVANMLTVDHCTCAGDTNGPVISFNDVSVLTGLTFTHNAAQQGVYGVFSNGVSAVCIPALNGSCYTYTVTNNVFGRNKTQSVTWPAGNTTIASPGIVFSGAPDWQLTGAAAGLDAGWSGGQPSTPGGGAP